MDYSRISFLHNALFNKEVSCYSTKFIQSFRIDFFIRHVDLGVGGLKGLEDFRSEFGLAASGPRYFGFDIDYVPIEELLPNSNVKE
jgi:hypothetical protein